jgi:hypothetical protein
MLVTKTTRPHPPQRVRPWPGVLYRSVKVQLRVWNSEFLPPCKVMTRMWRCRVRDPFIKWNHRVVRPHTSRTYRTGSWQAKRREKSPQLWQKTAKVVRTGLDATSGFRRAKVMDLSSVVFVRVLGMRIRRKPRSCSRSTEISVAEKKRGKEEERAHGRCYHTLRAGLGYRTDFPRVRRRKTPPVRK